MADMSSHPGGSSNDIGSNGGHSGTVQVQVIPTQTGINSTNGSSTSVLSNPGSLLASSGSHHDLSSAQLSQLGLRFPVDQQQKLLLAAQLQQLSKNQQSVNTSFVLQPTFQVVSSAPSATSTKGSGQYVSPYAPDGSILSQPVTQSAMMGIPNQSSYGGYETLHMPPVHGDHTTTNLQHANRAHPQTMHWLFENYETAEGVSLPRSTMYNHYLRHCAANKIDAVNAASFGKLIRSVFIGLKTRRLGTRGNSKYHYYGIRIKPESPLNTYPQEDSPVAVAMRQPAQNNSSREYKDNGSPAEGGEGSNQPQDMTPQQQHQQYLGDSRPELTQFPDIQWAGTPIPGALSSDDLNLFAALYREHCEAILDVVVNLQFQMVENLWRHFWAENPKQVDSVPMDDDSDQQLPKEKLFLLTSCQPVVDYLNSCDHILYQCIVDFLVPEVLRPIPGTLTQAIRNFAKSLESWLSSSLQGYSSNLVKAKICSMVAFSQTLRRYTSLNHLAQAARAVLQNPSQISQMLSDLNRVDFANVQEQASWVCECDEGLVMKLEQNFKTTLQQQQTLEQWAQWLKDVVSTILKPYEDGEKFPKAARKFLLKWSFYSSMVIRDLTLRSAASFGSFHLIRLLYDEYMFFLIEHKVAKATGRTPIAVMSEFSGQSRRVISVSENIAVNQTSEDNLGSEDEVPTAKRQKL